MPFDIMQAVGVPGYSTWKFDLLESRPPYPYSPSTLTKCRWTTYETFETEDVIQSYNDTYKISNLRVTHNFIYDGPMDYVLVWGWSATAVYNDVDQNPMVYRFEPDGEKVFVPGDNVVTFNVQTNPVNIGQE